MEYKDEDIAVIGIGCDFPGGEGLDNFWKVLVEGRNCAVEIPDERFDCSQWYDPDENKPGKTRTKRAALINGLNEFDQRFFGISDAEADQMDPQHKLLLQCSYRALEDAGIPMEKASGTRTGVFIGLMNTDFALNRGHAHPNEISHWTGTGVATSIASNRISYTFDLTGPSFTLDSACSSSLLALHLACQSIRQGDSDMALCGGVSCIIEPRVFVSLSKAKMISPDGTSKPFSGSADGYGRGEGCGIVLLKPFKKALQDSDHIWGIISKTAVNQDGHTASPMTKPSMVQQKELLSRIYSTPSDLTSVQYIEAHGTGTPVGDPIEAGSISEVIAKARPTGSEALILGSVKSNIGHTESAAGVAGLIKVLLMMKHETIVPSVFYSDDSASIDANALSVRIPMKVEKWQSSNPAGRVAGINNFGFGGTNAHAVIKQYKNSQVAVDEDRKFPSQQYVVLSAASEKSLTKMIADMLDETEKESIDSFQNLAYTSACRRSHSKHQYRKAFLASSLTHLKEQFRAVLTKHLKPSKLDTALVFVFCGNGVTYRGMCKQLLQQEPIFRQKVKEIEALLQSHRDTTIVDKLENDTDEDNDFSRPDMVQPLLFAIQVGIFCLFQHWGVKPDAVLGHSVGEVAAAHCSGLLSLEDAVKVIHYRSVLQNKVTGGKMLVVGNMGVSEVLKLLPQYSGRVCLAAVNSPQSCTLSGDADAIDKLQQSLGSLEDSDVLFLRALDVSTAYHSHHMNQILSELENTINLLQQGDRETELYSTVSGTAVSDADFCSGKYWARNIREPVLFESAVRAAAEGKKNVVFVEIGPKRALQRNIIETLGTDVTVLSSVQPGRDHETMLLTVGNLFERGFDVDWNTFYRGCETQPTNLPRYHFDVIKKPITLEANTSGSASNHPVLTKTSKYGAEFCCDLSSDSVSYLQDHKNNGLAILPGSFYVDLGLSAFMASAKPRVPLNTLELSISFQSPYLVNKNASEMRVKLEPGEDCTKFKVYSDTATFATGDISHRKGRVAEEPYISLEHVYERCTLVQSSDEGYRKLRLGGYQHSSVFQNKGYVHYGEELREVITVVTIPEQLHSQLHDYCIHPVVLDYFMQLLPAAAGPRYVARPGFPRSIASLTVFEPLQDEMAIYIRATELGVNHFEICGWFTDKQGKVLVEIKQVVVKYLGSSSDIVEQYFYHNNFTEAIEESESFEAKKTLVFADDLGIAHSLQPHLSSNCVHVSCVDGKDVLNNGLQSLMQKLSLSDNMDDFGDILFMWDVANITTYSMDAVVESGVNCCEIFRKIIVELKAMNYTNSIRTVTHGCADSAIDHVSLGFVLSGMTRACAAEVPDLLFQLIDISSVSSENIRALARVLSSYPCSKYPELSIKDGLVYAPNIVHTLPAISMDHQEGRVQLLESQNFCLKTADPYKMTNLTASLTDDEVNDVPEGHVEVQLNKICVHSADYFPVSTSALNFGETVYWNKYTKQDHSLLALDFSGTITAVGHGVTRLKVGDIVASCCPVAASSKVVISEKLCYSNNDVPFLKDIPCISHFVIAWNILHRTLPKMEGEGRLGVLSTVTDSSLSKVLAQTANKSGWNCTIVTEINGGGAEMKFDVCVLLPPFDKSLLQSAFSAPSVRNVVILCDSQALLSLSERILRAGYDSIYTHILHLPQILVKGQLTEHRSHIETWLKALHIDRHLLNLSSICFESVTPDSSDNRKVQEGESYFCTKTISVVTLNKEGDDKCKLSKIPLVPKEHRLFYKNCVYIVTGGLTGLGFETVKFIAERGGGYIVILSRRSPNSEMQQEIDAVKQQYGASIEALRCDVSVTEEVEETVSIIRQNCPSSPIKGVFHSAAVLHDGILEHLNRSLYEEVMKPKINGVLNLHHATKHCNLDYFVCYSSVASFTGSPAQSNYAAANSFLDKFCHYRRHLGLAAQSINWGALNLGLLLNKDRLQKILETRGLMVLELIEIQQSLQDCLLLNQPQQLICKFNFQNIGSNFYSQNASLGLRLAPLVKEKLGDIKAPDPVFEHAHQSTSEYVRSVLSKTLDVKPEEISEDTLLSALGIDSMLAMTLQSLLSKGRGVTIPLVKLLDPNSTMHSLIAVLNQLADKA
ncbi:phenolphthiocerol/phthiocerol polyketide synthase subunit C-like [Sardina pilchardus]|uniref:phenolphthiocerol/phthiocerol polyketide synthase subunit C-like n=1 Tax=Sardina pilchardus TaxID=27697 RepID=UPI002E1151C9